MKELTGGYLTTKEIELQKYLDSMKNIVFRGMKNTYGLDFDSIHIVDSDSTIISSSSNERALSVFILKDNLIDFRFVLKHEHNKFEIELNNHFYFNNEYEKFMTIFNTLFKEVEFIYMANATTRFNFDSFIYKFISPTIKPFDETIRVVGRNPYIKSLNSKYEMMYGDIRFDCMLGHEVKFYSDFLKKINKMLSAEETESISLGDSIESIQNKLSVLEIINY